MVMIKYDGLKVPANMSAVLGAPAILFQPTFTSAEMNVVFRE